MASEPSSGAHGGTGSVYSDSPLLAQPSAAAASDGDDNASAAPAPGFRASIGLANVARRTLGISMLMVTVSLWTTSNFLASYIFADSTYTKPFFVVYVNTSTFAISLIPMSIRFIWIHGARGTRQALRVLWRDLRRDLHAKASALRGGRWWWWKRNSGGGDDDDLANKLLEDEGGADVVRRTRNRPPAGDDGSELADADGEGEGLLRESVELRGDDEQEAAAADLEAAPTAATATTTPSTRDNGDEKLNLLETAWLSLEFCALWFAANYLAVACLQHTSVASATIFTSLSSVFTLLFCARFGVEGFTLRKLAGVAASLAGVALVSSVDLSGRSDEHRGDFPHKSSGEIAAGDAMALLSAVVYGAYVTLMKRRVGNEDRVDMPLFFGLVGLLNMLCLWPGFVLLHATGLEPFELPPTGKVWIIILVNAVSSFASDMTWAYAMLLTTPLVVTVGLSLTIPLSLVGEMIEYNQYSSALYWVGAGIVVVSFLFVNHESREKAADEPEGPRAG